MPHLLSLLVLISTLCGATFTPRLPFIVGGNLHNSTTIPANVVNPYPRTIDIQLTFYRPHPPRLIFTNLVVADLQATADTIPASADPRGLFRGVEFGGRTVTVKFTPVVPGGPTRPPGLSNEEAKAEMVIVMEQLENSGPSTRPAYWVVSVKGQRLYEKTVLGLGGFH